MSIIHSEILELIVDRRATMKGLISTAVTKAIDDCIAEGILADFFREHRQEVIDMSITEYLSEELAEVYKEDGFEEGRIVGHKEGRKEGIEERDAEKIAEMLKDGKTPEAISDFCKYPLEQVKAVQKEMLVGQ